MGNVGKSLVVSKTVTDLSQLKISFRVDYIEFSVPTQGVLVSSPGVEPTEVYAAENGVAVSRFGSL